MEICYNKFLAYYKLPLLKEPQTINSFKQHLTQNNAKHLACYTLITVNSDKTEAHIYLPHESEMLPNHYVLSIYDSYNIPLKSQTNIPIFPSISPTLFRTTSNPNQSTNNYLNNSGSGSNQALNLSICTHNVRGYNTDLKQQIWEDFCLSNNLNIISITETKISNTNPIIRLQRSKHFTYYWSCTNSSKAGTAIMINNWIKPHIHKIFTFPGYAIATDIFFKHDFKFRIISVYLPCDDLQLRLQIQNTIIQ